jgi:hypothetical protein
MSKGVSFSQAKTWRQCRQKWHYKYKQKLRAKGRSAEPLWRGTIVHEMLENHLMGRGWTPTLAKYQAEFAKLMEEEKAIYGHDFVDNCGRIMQGYVDHWAKHAPVETVAVEVEFGESEPCELIPGLFVRGRIDWLFRDHRGLWVGEHKTVKKAIPSTGFRMTDMQTAMYAKVVEKLGYGKPVGVAFDYLRTKPPTKPRQLKDKSLSKARKIDTDKATLLAAIDEYGLDPKDYAEQLERAAANVFYARKFLPKPQAISDQLLVELRIQSIEMNRLGDQPYRNPVRECDKCEYQSICNAELMGLDSDYLRKAEFYVAEKPVLVEREEIDGEEEAGGE